MASSSWMERTGAFSRQSFYIHVFSLILSTFPNTWIHVLTSALVMHFWLILFLFLSCQAIRVLGLLGALDPYKHKVNIGMIDQSRDASAVSLSESKSSQDSCKYLERHLFSLLFQVNTFVIYKQVFIFNVFTCLFFLLSTLLVYIFHLILGCSWNGIGEHLIRSLWHYLLSPSGLQYQWDAGEHGKPPSGWILSSCLHGGTDENFPRSVLVPASHYGSSGHHLYFQISWAEVCAVPAPGHANVP